LTEERRGSTALPAEAICWNLRYYRFCLESPSRSFSLILSRRLLGVSTFTSKIRLRASLPTAGQASSGCGPVHPPAAPVAAPQAQTLRAGHGLRQRLSARDRGGLSCAGAFSTVAAPYGPSGAPRTARRAPCRSS
jgi:hypothetical protein